MAFFLSMNFFFTCATIERRSRLDAEAPSGSGGTGGAAAASRTAACMLYGGLQ